MAPGICFPIWYVHQAGTNNINNLQYKGGGGYTYHILFLLTTILNLSPILPILVSFSFFLSFIEGWVLKG